MLQFTRSFSTKSAKSKKSLPPPIVKPQIERNAIFYSNKWHKSKSGETFKAINPATEEVITEIQKCGPDDINAAVEAANDAFKPGSPWRTMNATRRGLLLNKLANLMQKNKVLLASIETLDNGMTYATSLGAISMAIQILQYYAGWADKYHGKTISANSGFHAYTRHEPIGVCAQITPWNLPLLLLVWKIAPALAMGNTVVVKPASNTALSTLYTAGMVKEAGFPPGVVNIVPGPGPVGEFLCKHPKVDKIAFTGSTEVGKLILDYSHFSNLKRTSLELGGKNPHIVLADVDIDKAVGIAQDAVYFNQGQTCSAGSRTFVEAKIYDAFVNKSVEMAKKRIVGDPFDLKTQQGPQISKAHLGNILRLIKTGTAEGVAVLTGGKKLGDKGYFLEPTVLANVEDQHTVAKEEIFGPVQTILKFNTLEEVVQRANNSQYGLAAGIQSNDLDKVMYLSSGLRAGVVWCNCHNVTLPQVPFGGCKDSGFGRELGEYGLHEYTEVKTVIMKVKRKF